MGCCNNPNYQSRAARESINRSAYEACQCADRSCECKDLAEQYAQNAEDTWNDLQTRYLGAYSVAPVTSTTGALYFNTVSNQMFVWNGTTWTAVPAATIIGDGDKGDITVSGLGSTWTIDNGAVTSAKIADGTIVNGDISNTAAIAGTKISPNFGSQDVITTGNVGIGTTSPASKLHVVGPNALRISGGSGDYTAAQLINTSGVELQVFANANLGAGILTTTNHPLDFLTNNTQRLRIDASGSVGIGTSSPAAIAKLDVQGGRTLLSANSEPYAVGAKFVNTGGAVYFGAASNSATPDAVISSAGGAELMRITNGGDVGIGTSSPSSKLHVDGDITVSSATTANTATAGAQTLPANPVGFLVVSINGISRKIPYYAT